VDWSRRTADLSSDLPRSHSAASTSRLRRGPRTVSSVRTARQDDVHQSPARYRSANRRSRPPCSGGSADDPMIRKRIGYLPERLELPQAWSPRAFLHSVGRLKGLANRGRGCEAAAIENGPRQRGRAAHRRIFEGHESNGWGSPPRSWGRPIYWCSTSRPTESIRWDGWRSGASRGGTRARRGHPPELALARRDGTRLRSRRDSFGGQGRSPGGLEELCGTPTDFRLRFENGYDEGRLRQIASYGGKEKPSIAKPPRPRLERAHRPRAFEWGMLLELTRDLRDLEDVLAEAVRP